MGYSYTALPSKSTNFPEEPEKAERTIALARTVLNYNKQTLSVQGALSTRDPEEVKRMFIISSFGNPDKMTLTDELECVKALSKAFHKAGGLGTKG